MIQEYKRTVPSFNESESPEDYFRRIMNWSERAKEAVDLHKRWVYRHLNGIRELDCKERIRIVLKEVLESGLLRYDWYYDTGIPRSDREEAVIELQDLNMEELLQIEGADWKFALLSVVRNKDKSRIVIEDYNAGIYIKELYDKLSSEDVEAFCRFVTFTRLSYQEIDRLKAESTDSIYKACLANMIADLEPLREHIKPEYINIYDSLWEKALSVGDIKKKLKQVSPNTFKGGYNQKLTCNLVGILCSEGVFDLNPKQTDALIYPGKTHYTYINNYAASDTSSELTREEIIAIKNRIKKHT